MWNFAVIVSVNITPIISGYVIVDLSWRWAFGLLSIFFGVLLICIVLLFPETTFNRAPARTSVSVAATDSSQRLEDLNTLSGKSNFSSSTQELNNLKKISGNKPIQPGFSLSSDEITDREEGTVTRSVPAWKRLLGIKNVNIKDQRRIVQLCLGPFLLITHPAVIWGCCMWAVVFTWVIIQGAVADQIFHAPPYSMSATSVGILIGIAPLIGSALGTSLAGWSSDVISRAMAVRNRGVFEPEYRLVVGCTLFSEVLDY